MLRNTYILWPIQEKALITYPCLALESVIILRCLPQCHVHSSPHNVLPQQRQFQHMSITFALHGTIGKLWQDVLNYLLSVILTISRVFYTYYLFYMGSSLYLLVIVRTLLRNFYENRPSDFWRGRVFNFECFVILTR